MVNFGTQNLQEYNMSNFASLLASVRGSTSTGAAMGGTLMNVKAAQDYFKLRDLMTSLGDIGGEMGKEFIELETARGKGQLLGGVVGGIGGFLLSGGNPWAAAAGAGAGSYGGGRVATRRDVSDLAAQERAAKRSLESFGGTFFGSSRLKEAKSYGKDLERYVSSAKTQLKDKLVKNALMDALYAYSGAKSFLKYDPRGVGKDIGSFITGKDYAGSDVIGGLKEYYKAGDPVSTAAGLATTSVDPRVSDKYVGTRGMADISGLADPRLAATTPIGVPLREMVGYESGGHLLPEPFSLEDIFGAGIGSNRGLLPMHTQGQMDWGLGLPGAPHSLERGKFAPLFQTGIFK